jgi:hypothetical protein
MFQGPVAIADQTAHASSRPHVSYVAIARNDLQPTQDMQQQAWCSTPAHAAAAAVGSMDANLVAARNSTAGMLDAIPSADWLMLQQQREQHLGRLAAAGCGGATAALTAAIAAAGGGASRALAIPDSLLGPPAHYLQQQPLQQPLRGVPEHIPVVAPALMPSTFHPPTQHVAAAVTRAAAVCGATREVLLDLHPDAFVLVAGSLDLVEKLSGAVLRIVERGQMPLGLRVLGRQEEVVVACELTRSLAGC